MRQQIYTLLMSGDFNIDLSTVSASQTLFTSILESNGFNNLIECLTFDLFITNNDNEHGYSGVILSDVSDPFTIFIFSFIRKFRSKTSIPLQEPIFAQQMNAQRLDMFFNAIGNTDWSLVYIKKQQMKLITFSCLL